MVVSRASGTLIASSLKQNKLLTLKWHPAGGHTPYGRSPKSRAGRRVPRGAQGVPRGADEASPRGGAGPYSGVPSMR